MKIVFIDESGDQSLDKISPEYPIFTLVACVFDFDCYYRDVVPSFSDFKTKHFGQQEVILRSYDIRKQKGPFVSLSNKESYELFMQGLDSLVGSTDFMIIGSLIDKVKLQEQYYSPGDPYALCFAFILERLYKQFGGKDVCIIRAESRDNKSNTSLTDIFSRYQDRDGKYSECNVFKKSLVDLSFNQKKQNIVGLQVADLVAYAIGRGILNGNSYHPFEIIKPKFRKSSSGKIIGYGLKVFP